MYFSYAWIGFLPAIFWIGCFFLLPLTNVLWIALYGPNALDSTLNVWGISSIINVLNSPHFVIVTIRTILVAGLCCAISLSLAIPVGYYLASIKRRERTRILFLIMNVFWTSFLVRIFGWKLLLHPEGILNSLLISLRIIPENSMLLYTPAALLLTMVHVSLPFAILPIYSSVDRFDFSLIEAASDLGASPYQSFFLIFLPSIRPAIIKATVMVFLPIMSSYAFSSLIGGASSELLGNKIVRLTLLERNFSEGSALSLITSVLGLLVVFSLYFLFRSNRSKK